MATIKVNFNNEKGKIKPMHAVGQPPFAGGFNKLDVTCAKDIMCSFIKLQPSRYHGSAI